MCSDAAVRRRPNSTASCPVSMLNFVPDKAARGARDGQGRAVRTAQVDADLMSWDYVGRDGDDASLLGRGGVALDSSRPRSRRGTAIPDLQAGAAATAVRGTRGSQSRCGDPRHRQLARFFATSTIQSGRRFSGASASADASASSLDEDARRRPCANGSPCRPFLAEPDDALEIHWIARAWAGARPQSVELSPGPR